MEKKTMYNRKLINDWFWYRLEKEQHITKDDLEYLDQCHLRIRGTQRGCQAIRW